MTAEADPAPIVLDTTDQLLAALVSLTRLNQQPWSASALVAGLPLEAGCLTPALFVRAAGRAGFAASLVERDVASISEAIFPVVALRNDGGCCLVFGCDKDSATVSISEPATPDNRVSLDLATFRQHYSGSCLFFKAETDDAGGEQAHWFWKTLSRSRGLYGEVIVASLMVNLFALVSPLFVMNVYDRVVPNQAFDTLWVLATGVGIVVLFDLLIKMLRGYFIDTAGKRADILLSAQSFSRVMDIQMQSRPERIGSFANNLQEFDTFREFFTSTTLITLIDLPFVLLFIYLIYAIGGPLAMVPLVAIPAVLAVGLFLQMPLQAIVKQSFTEGSRKHGMLIETLANLDTIKSARAEGVMQRRWEVFNARLARLALRSRSLSMFIVNFTQAIAQLATVAIVIVGVYAISRGELSVGGLIACTILTGRCLAPMSQVANVLTRLHHAVAAYNSINNLMSLPVERPDGRKFLQRGEINGDISLRNVSFNYTGQQIAALQDISLSVRPGERIAIIGKTGSGKSTLQKLILKFYLPVEGTILIDGTDINQIDPTDLRRDIAYVPQDITLFDGTIRDNISLGAPLSTDEEVIAAAALAGIDEFIDQHPEGFDLGVGERGASLSGGQRQGVAIARALITGANVLLLDEPTNAMDNASELAFITRLRDYIAGRTLILVTHKTSMLALVDRLVVLNDGRIVADGPREEILRILRGQSQ